MPSIRVLSNPFAKETKEALALALCTELKRILKVPVIETYFHELDVFYVLRGEFTVHDGSVEPGAATLIINGPVREQAELQEVCSALTTAFRQVVGNDLYEVITVYHEIDGDFIGSNGTIHSLRPKKGP
ncbi:MAG: hypothetical protein FWG10_11205 [Eubacteriaceae bacterium]|nr:hypothetical protein [Eubacteriaceae bacterium]